MVEPSPRAVRPFDAVAAEAVRRRLGRQPAPPWLHGEVARRMAERLDFIRIKPRLILDWWSFLGAGADLLRVAYPDARRVRVEPDAALAARSRAALARPWWSLRKPSASPADVLFESDPLPHGVQLVWANMMLHAVADPPALFERWQGLLGIDGFVMFSCLGPDTVRELRELYARLGWPAPVAPFVDMHDLGDMLVASGFADPVMDQESLTLHWQDPAALLTELRSMGGNTSPARAAGLRTPRWRRGLEAALERLRGSDGRLHLTFELAYGHAFKAAPRVRPEEPTIISLEDMRALVSSGRSRRS